MRSHFAQTALRFVRRFSFLRALLQFGFADYSSASSTQLLPRSFIRLRHAWDGAGSQLHLGLPRACSPPSQQAQFVRRVCLVITLWRAYLISGTQAVCIACGAPLVQPIWITILSALRVY